MYEMTEQIDGVSPNMVGGVPEKPVLSPSGPRSERAEARDLALRLGKDVEACRAIIRRTKGKNKGSWRKITNVLEDGYNPRYLTKYGLTHDAYHKMWNQQDGRCAICFRFEPLQVDHSHADGHVRGLLCGTCNRGLGQFQDSPVLLAEGVKYLKRHVRKVY